MKTLSLFTCLFLAVGFAVPANAQMFYDNSARQNFVGPYSSTDEIADDTPFTGTQHVASFTFEYSNTNSTPINATVRFYNVDSSTGRVGSLVATIPVSNLPAGQFQLFTVNLDPSQQFDWTAMSGIYGVQSVSGGFFSLQFSGGADFQQGWYEAAGASLDGFVDVTTGQFLNFGQDINASFYLQISGAPTASTLSSISVHPQLVKGGQSTTATVSLTAPAPAGGLLVKLMSNKPTIARSPASVTIPAGATSATVTVNTRAVSTATNVIISAAANGALKTVTLGVKP